MSYLENTPFSPITLDSKTGEALSPEALENRERLILLWKIQDGKQAALAEDINDPETHCETALTGEEFLDLLRSLLSWHKHSQAFPILKMEKLQEIAAIRLEESH